MASTCISSCTNDVVAIPTPIPRANYANLYKRPESDAEFILRSISNNNKTTTNITSNRFSLSTKVVDSLSCRQMYLRSYTFSRKETFPDKTKKYVDRARVIRVKLKLLAHRRHSSDLGVMKVKKTRLLGLLGKGFAVGRRIRKRLQLQLFFRIRKAISTRDHLLSSSALLLRRLLIACTCTCTTSKIDA